MIKGDIIVGKECINESDYYSKLVKPGNKYEVIDSEAYVGPDGFEKIFISVTCVITHNKITLLPAYFFMTISRYREYVLEKLYI